MVWYEIVLVAFALVSFGVSFAYMSFWEVRRIRETIERERLQKYFYDEVGNYFARLNDMILNEVFYYDDSLF